MIARIVKEIFAIILALLAVAVAMGLAAPGIILAGNHLGPLLFACGTTLLIGFVVGVGVWCSIHESMFAKPELTLEQFIAMRNRENQ